MDSKLCFKCGLIRPLGMFYKHAQMGDGHLNKCIECTKTDTKRRFDEKIKDPLFVEKERTRGRNKYHKYKYKGDSKLGNEKYRIRYPEKYAAKCASKRIKLEFEGAEKHHWSYNQEHRNDIIQLSVKDHKKGHRFLIYDQERMMYRTTDNVLLDTKEAHLEYINNKIATEPD